MHTIVDGDKCPRPEPTIVEEPDPQRRPVVATVTRRTNKELITLYRARKAENRPRDKAQGSTYRMKNLGTASRPNPTRLKVQSLFHQWWTSPYIGETLELLFQDLMD